MKSLFTTTALGALALAALAVGTVTQNASADQPIVGLVTQTPDNPFWGKVLAGATSEAAKDGVTLRNVVGQDNDGQVTGVENLVSAGAKVILIAPADSTAIVPAVKAARDAGVLVISIDHPTAPPSAADATVATDNFEAGTLIGQWALKTLGDKASSAKIAMLDNDETQNSVDVARDHGFLKGFGISFSDPNRNGSENDPRIVGHATTQSGTIEGGRTAMENLLQKDSGVNVVYTINEQAAAGAYEALKAAGKTDGVLLVSVDGSCSGVKNVKAGVIGATAMQFPIKIASISVDAAADFIKTGNKPQPSPGLDFVNTGVRLITDKPAAGIDSDSSDQGLNECWG